MTLLRRNIHVIAREVIARLFAEVMIHEHPLWVYALELELAGVMRSYVAENARLDNEVREALERLGGHSPERFAQLKQELAHARGFPLGDAGVARMVETMTRRIDGSPLANSIGMSARAVQEEVLSLMRRHLGSSLEEQRGRRLESPVMTPQQQQAIQLFQLSRMELLETIREEMGTDPLLEEPDEPPDG